MRALGIGESVYPVKNPFEPPIGRMLVVTGHPNHELAILGIIQRARPHVLVLTDGGGPQRVAESRAVYERLGLLDRVRFLDVPEKDLYQALLDRSPAALETLAAETRRMIEQVSPQYVLCESLEFYNPVHDLSLPVVQAAAKSQTGVKILEFPLIAERADAPGQYRVQRPPASREREARSLKLDPGELAFKLEASVHSYPSLRTQMGGVLDAISSGHATEEFFLEANGWMPEPGRDQALRYEERGRLLAHEGVVERVITFKDHFLPTVAALRASA